MCDSSELRAMLSVLQRFEPAADDEARIDRITLLEQARSAVAAAQALETKAFVESQRAKQQAAGVPADRVGQGIASQVGLARRISPWLAQRYVSAVMVLPTELPRTFAELRAGRTSESRAITMVRETVFLTRADRAAVDADLAPRLAGWGDRRVEAEARKAAYRLDPAGSVDRARAAVRDRRVSLRPAPDCMTRLSALLPVAQGVAVYAALKTAADTTVGTGDPDNPDAPRSRGQVMADTLVQRVTGQARAEDVPVEVHLVMTDTSVLTDPGTSGRDEPGYLLGYGPIPAGIARHLAHGTGQTAPRWIRRLYRHPVSGQLIAMDTRRRLFTSTQRRFLELRDQTCRTPWCDAPIRHADHTRDHHHGGPTSLDNGNGRCAACNYAKAALDWHTSPAPLNHMIIDTPTGHRYDSDPPDPPGEEPDLAPRRRPRAVPNADCG